LTKIPDDEDSDVAKYDNTETKETYKVSPLNSKVLSRINLLVEACQK